MLPEPPKGACHDYDILSRLRQSMCLMEVREWHRKYAREPEPCGEDASVEDLKVGTKRLRKELRNAEIEREIQKNATAYFAYESQ